jgi:hypothetical protein
MSRLAWSAVLLTALGCNADDPLSGFLPGDDVPLEVVEPMLGPPGPPLTLTMPDLLVDTEVTLAVDGTMYDGEVVYFLGSRTLGPGRCPRIIGQQCMGIETPMVMLGDALASDDLAEFQLQLESSLLVDGQDLAVQAVAVRGILGENSSLSNPVIGTGFERRATGGVETDLPGFKVHTFTTDGTFTVSGNPLDVEVLVVAGGGGGGGRSGGGGGAGGVVYAATHSLAADAVIDVTVGAGGTGGSGSGAVGANGADSVFDVLTAFGGGGGGSDNTAEVGQAGGSGGGGQYDGAGGAGTAGQGHAGAHGHAGNPWTSGGGGGAGGAGIPGISSDVGDGGPGLSFDISGTPTFYGGGGGGGGHTTCNGHGNGGVGGGGDGGTCNTISNGLDGAANTGGGGGGGQTTGGSGGRGGHGGSGIVIVRYPI